MNLTRADVGNGVDDPGRLAGALSKPWGTLAGNLTLVGSVANLIVAERARAKGIEVSFGAYCYAGVPLTLLTLAFGAWWLS